MTSKSGIIQASTITREDFDSVLQQYPDLIQSISDEKGAKDGQRTLEQLDEYRYKEAPQVFGGEKPQRAMSLDDVKILVEWKLRHGKFRPTLMNLVSSNDSLVAENVIKDALDAYRKKSNAQAALNILTKLKGIGPATASLLLTVHDPSRVIFFSDEAFYWLCCSGAKRPIKYNAKEYVSLRDQAETLFERLGVSATDVEKVAYVLMKQQSEQVKPSQQKITSKKEAKTTKQSSNKRKLTPEPIKPEDDGSKTTTLRRSKRARA